MGNQRHACIVGANSILTTYLEEYLSEKYQSVSKVSSNVMTSMNSSDLRRYWQAEAVRSDLLLWSGAVLIPDADAGTLKRVNVDTPLAAIQSFVEGRPENRVVTFGSALEGIALQNPYIASKKALFDELKGMGNPNVMHVRTHTLIGEELPHGHMFLGQLLRAIQAKENFLMHGTKQVRQFIHYRDFAQATVKAVQSEVPAFQPLTTVGARASTNLFMLATLLMEHFNPKGCVELDTSKAWPTDQTSSNQAENDVLIGPDNPAQQIQELMEGWLKAIS